MTPKPIQVLGQNVFKVPELRLRSCSGCVFEHEQCGQRQSDDCWFEQTIFVTDLEAYQVAQVTNKLVPEEK